MHRRYFWLAVALAVLIVSATGYILAGNFLYAQYQTSLASYTTSCDTLISWNPPTQIYTGLYANERALVTVQYRSPIRQALRISLSIPQFTLEQSTQVTATPSFQPYTFKPPILSPTAATLDAVGTGQRAAQLHLQVQSLNKTLCDTSVPVTLFSRQIMLWRDPSGVDNSAFLAGWVTPDAQVITNLIGLAANRLTTSPASYPSTSSMHGYAGGATPDDVRGQVNALFDTMQFNYHVHYANDNALYNTDATQRILLPADILTQKAPTGMCVETTAILASAVEHLGMRPSIVIIPGHAFLGVALSADGTHIEYWETSYLNGQTGSQAHVYGQNEYQTKQILHVIDIYYERLHDHIQPIE